MNNCGCLNLPQYLSGARDRLSHALDENKWYLSERAGRDVGRTAAGLDFIDHHLDRVVRGFRAEFCHETCTMRTGCPLARTVDRIPPLRERTPSPGDPRIPPR